MSDKTDLTEIKETIRQQALSEGFDVCGFGPPQIPPRNQERYRAFVEKGEHASMAWLENRLNQRVDPQALWDQVQSVMVVGQNYAPSDDPKQDWARRLADPEHAHISAYARGKDYHDVLKKRLKRVGRWLCQEFASLGADVKVFVDTAPIPEKALAQMAGVGWQGKHTNLVNRDYGSYLFLGVMYLSLQLPPDPAAPHADQCGTCTACIDVCPTNAIEVPYQLNASKCIAYWNIEHKGDDPIPAPSPRRWAIACLAAMIAWPSARGTSSPSIPLNLPLRRDRPQTARQLTICWPLTIKASATGLPKHL